MLKSYQSCSFGITGIRVQKRLIKERSLWKEMRKAKVYTAEGVAGQTHGLG